LYVLMVNLHYDREGPFNGSPINRLLESSPTGIQSEFAFYDRVLCGFIKRPAPKGNSIAGGSQKLQKQTGQVAQKIDPPVSSFGCHPSQGPNRVVDRSLTGGIMVSPRQTSPDDLDMKQLLTVLTAYRKGNFTVRMPIDLTGLPGKVADTLNEIIDMAQETTAEFERVAQLVGKQGKVGERIELPAMKGSWARLVESSNALANDLVSPMNEMIRIVGAVAEGDLSQSVSMEIDGLKLQGQFLQSAQIVNTMVARLGTFSSEVTRVAREVGTDGILGGQAEVADVSGTWKDLTDSVNGMAANLTTQVRNIADVTTAVAKGDL